VDNVATIFATIFAGILKRKAADSVPVFPFRDPLHEFEKCEFTLASHNGIHEGFTQRLIHCQAGMPPAKYNRQLRTMPFYSTGDPYSRSNVGASKNRYAQAQCILGLSKDRLLVVSDDEVIDRLDFEARLHQGRSQAKQ
jgi:hypothetical protein